MTQEERIAQLEAKIHRMKDTIRWMQEALVHKNRALDAMHWVWCDGGCPGGVHRYPDEDGIMRHAELTEATVREAERNTQRLRRWYDIYQARLQRYNAMIAASRARPVEPFPTPYDPENADD
jgi:hypothetical protein